MFYYYPYQVFPWRPGYFYRPISFPQPWMPQQGYYVPVQQPETPQPFMKPPGSSYGRATEERPSQASAPVQSKELTPELFTAQDLDQETLDKIISKYGADIEDIFHLSPGQKWMFGRAQTVTNAFFLQVVFKVTMDLKPASFRQKLDEVSLKRSSLRTAFAYRDLKEPYQALSRDMPLFREGKNCMTRSPGTVRIIRSHSQRYCFMPLEDV